MNKIAFYHFVKKKSLLLTFFVLFSLFISENIFATKYWEKNNVVVEWQAHSNSVLIKTKVYDYSFLPNSKHGYLRWCQFRFFDEYKKPHILMEYFTEWQNESNKTMVSLENKLKYARIYFLQDVDILPTGAMWKESDKRLDVKVANYQKSASLSLRWHLSNNFKEIRYIQISGMWNTYYPYNNEPFNDIIYNINRPCPSALKSDTPDINTKVTEPEIVKMYKDSEDIVIKGAEPGANIKVYTTTGTEIKSAISTNDVVKIKLPAKQIYLVHIGKSRYKVSLCVP